MEYDSTVRRFAQGTPNIPGLYSFLPGLKIIEEIGVRTIAAESRRRTQHMIDYALDRGWRLHCPPMADQRGGTVMIEVERSSEAVAALSECGVFCDCRPGVGLRLSPHFFNTDDEIDAAVRIIDELKIASPAG